MNITQNVDTLFEKENEFYGFDEPLEFIKETQEEFFGFEEEPFETIKEINFMKIDKNIIDDLIKLLENNNKFISRLSLCIANNLDAKGH